MRMFIPFSAFEKFQRLKNEENLYPRNLAGV